MWLKIVAIISGQIETLKTLKRVLSDNGIQRFKSIAEINDFNKNFTYEKNQLPIKIESDLQNELNALKILLSDKQNNFNHQKEKFSHQIQQKIDHITERKKAVTESANSIIVFFNPILSKYLERKLNKLQLNFNHILAKKLRKYKSQVDETSKKIKHMEDNSDSIKVDRLEKETNELNRTKDIVESLYPTIAGAIGENLVVKTVGELSDGYYLINDFKTEFNPPIFDKKTSDKIFSIQIDHLLISKAGVFLIETKNWSQKSIHNLDLRSPVDQIQRSSYALFVLLNSFTSDLELDDHHWGSKSVPVRSIMAMTNAKPKKEFKNVKILKLDEINGYIKYFDDLFSTNEVDILINFLKANNTSEEKI